MLVHFVTDEPSKIAAIRGMLEPRFSVVPQVLGEDDASGSSSGVLMVDADLRQMVRVEQIRLVLRRRSGITEKLFVVRNQVRSMVEQAYALGATEVISCSREVVSRLALIVERSTQTDAAGAEPEIIDGAAAFAAMFLDARNGKPLSIADAERATSRIINSIEKNKLSPWLDDVRRYHQGTFQHCLLVTGIAVGFAMDIGFDAADVKRLGIAATLHDIGKARIPLCILDKPGRLDPEEEEVMRRHPVIGYELLKDIPDINPEILDGVRHHHEYLDGSGYPDALKAPQISDLVRLLTISDIFAALIESRPYRPAMPRAEAYKILCGMDGQLERSLVKAFGHVALAG
jgi:putative nucleotidyltransferase with HDIG domain